MPWFPSILLCHFSSDQKTSFCDCGLFVVVSCATRIYKVYLHGLLAAWRTRQNKAKPGVAGPAACGLNLPYLMVTLSSWRGTSISAHREECEDICLQSLPRKLRMAFKTHWVAPITNYYLQYSRVTTVDTVAVCTLIWCWFLSAHGVDLLAISCFYFAQNNHSRVFLISRSRMHSALLGTRKTLDSSRQGSLVLSVSRDVHWSASSYLRTKVECIIKMSVKGRKSTCRLATGIKEWRRINDFKAHRRMEGHRRRRHHRRWCHWWRRQLGPLMLVIS